MQNGPAGVPQRRLTPAPTPWQSARAAAAAVTNDLRFIIVNGESFVKVEIRIGDEKTVYHRGKTGLYIYLYVYTHCRVRQPAF